MQSNVNNKSPVPVTAATVTMTAETVIVVVAASPLAVAVPVRHETVVPDDHDVVAQSTDARLAVGVALMDAKAKPLRVEVVPPDVGALAAPTRELSTGAEKVGKNQIILVQNCYLGAMCVIAGIFRKQICGPYRRMRRSQGQGCPTRPRQ